MEQKNTQVNNLTPNEAAASLAFATNLSQQMMPKMAPQTQEMAPGEEETPEMEKDTETKIMDELNDLKEEIKKLQPKEKEQEIAEIRKELETLLDNENENEKGTED